jgi:hypothetical protein
MTMSPVHTDRRHISARRSVRGDLAKDAGLLGVLWVAYAIVRGITAGDLAAATDNARAIIDFQHALGLPSEASLQAAVLDQQWILKAANLYCIGVHFLITVSFLAWARRFRVQANS